MKENIIGFIGLFIFLGVGIFMGSYLLIKRFKKKKICTHVVQATIIKVTEKRGHSDSEKISYYPTYEYEYNGIKYETKYSDYGAAFRPKIGKKQSIYINPNNPKIILKKNDFYPFLAAIFGYGFALLCIYGMFMLIKSI